MRTKRRTSLGSLVGMASKRPIDGLEEEIIDVSWQRMMGKKLSKYISSYTVVSNVPVFEEKLMKGGGEFCLLWLEFYH